MLEYAILVILSGFVLRLSYSFWNTARKLRQARGFEQELLLDYLIQVIGNCSVGDVARFSTGANQIIMNFSVYGNKTEKMIDWIVPVSKSKPTKGKKVIETARIHNIDFSVEELDHCKVIFLDLGDLSNVSQAAIQAILSAMDIEATKMAIEDVDMILPSKYLLSQEARVEALRTNYPERKDLNRLLSSVPSFLSVSSAPLVNNAPDQCL